MKNMPSNQLLENSAPFLPISGYPEIKARQAEEIYMLWQAWEKECGMVCPVPHWAIVWPAANVLARYLLDHSFRVKDKSVLEIGCGGAVASIAAKLAGATKVFANDIDPVTLEIAAQNAQVNQVNIRFILENLLESKNFPDTDVILLADFFYLKEDSEKALVLLDEWKQAGKTILISDGGRFFAPKKYSELLLEVEVEVDYDLENHNKRNVRILRY